MVLQEATQCSSLCDARRRLSLNELSSEALARSCLERIARREPDLHAWSHVDAEGAVQQARRRDREVLRSPLHGLPVGIKDIFDTADLPTECGTPIHRGRRPTRDARVVACLRAAGAVVLGKTVTTEFATFTPAATRNPLDLERTPGGSSSGSAAAVADGMVPLALASQTVGSTIRPASFCGVAGFKPTRGRVPLDGMSRTSERLDTFGLIARTAGDIELAASVLFASVAPRRPGAIQRPHRPLRVALVRTPWWAHADPDSRTALEDAAARLATAGCVVLERETPAGFDELVDAHDIVTAVEVAHSLGPQLDAHPRQVSAKLRELIERGRRIAQSDYRRALARGDRCEAEAPALFDGIDVVLTPAVTGAAPLGLESTGDPIFCRAWTFLGTPALTIPSSRGRAGLPIGIQLVAPPGRDEELLSSATWIEQQL